MWVRVEGLDRDGERRVRLPWAVRDTREWVRGVGEALGPDSVDLPSSISGYHFPGLFTLDGQMKT